MTAIPDQRRAQIIEAARSIIERDGTTKLTAASVAQAVGVSRPLLYHYFANMDELVEEVVSQYVVEFEARFGQWYEEHADDSVDTGLSECAAFMHAELDKHCPWGIEGPSLGPDGRTRVTYLSRCSKIVSEGLTNKEGALSRAIRETVPFPEKTLRVLVLGLSQYQQAQPETTVEEIGQIVSKGFGFGTRTAGSPSVAPTSPAIAGKAAADATPESASEGASAHPQQPRKKGCFERFLSSNR